MERKNTSAPWGHIMNLDGACGPVGARCWMGRGLGPCACMLWIWRVHAGPCPRGDRVKTAATLACCGSEWCMQALAQDATV
eukprot:350843-Chlamydomonas_euryale.AAC.3